VTTVEGFLWRIDLANPTQPPVAFGNVSALIAPRRGDEGLLGIAFEPGNAGEVYLNYTTGTQYYIPYSANPTQKPTQSVMPPNPKRNRIARYGITGGVLDTSRMDIIYESLRPSDWHTVNQITFGPDGYLYAGSGDGGWLDATYDQDRGQGVGNELATIIRIDPNDNGPGYTIPPGNPFADGPGPNADEVWVYGTRNPWRISFDRLNGNLWAGDVGQWGWEEVNKIAPGGNYGWYIMENNTCRTCPAITPPANHVLPRTAYCNANNPSAACQFDDECAMIGGYVYRGNAMPELQGYYIYADFCSGRIRAVDTTSPNSPPIILFDSDIDLGITSFAETPDGELLVVAYKVEAPGNAIHILAKFGDSDGDGDLDASDNCPAVYNPSQSNVDLDGLGDLCDSGDFDRDGYSDSAESRFIGTNPAAPCGAGWPSNLVDPVAQPADHLDIYDLTSFLAPVRRLDSNPGDATFSTRWDLVPGLGGFPNYISIHDLVALLDGPTGAPPMFDGARAYDKTCPSP
jgi:hypothetical protein